MANVSSQSGRLLWGPTARWRHKSKIDGTNYIEDEKTQILQKTFLMIFLRITSLVRINMLCSNTVMAVFTPGRYERLALKSKHRWYKLSLIRN